MTIFLTGGLGKTTSRTASILQSRSVPLLIGTRSGKAASYPAVKFDWTDRSTWDGVFTTPAARESPISAAYLVVLGPEDPYAVLVDFITFARETGVKRFVFLSTSAIDQTSESWYGKTHKYIAGLEGEGVEWTVVRPSWFMQNFSDSVDIQPIKAKSQVVSATADGKIPFVDADDIAAVVAEALTIEKPLNRDVLVLGPELLSYSDVAEVLSDLLGRRITHVRHSRDEAVAYLKGKGIPEAQANILADLDVAIAAGSEARLSDDFEKVVGRKPGRFRAFAEKQKGIW